MDKAIALLSGGLDSSVAAWMARDQNWNIEVVLTFNYGQRAALREIEAASAFAKYLGAEHLVLELPFFSAYSNGNGLLNKGLTLPSPTTTQLNDQTFSEQSASAVWVPNRNGILIEIAAGIAEDRNCQGVIVGFNVEEAATFPDNSKAYLNAINQALAFSTADRVKVFSPTVDMNKQQIVELAQASGFPFESLWSCYEGREKMCGNCESCMRLKRALNANEVSFDRLFDHASL